MWAALHGCPHPPSEYEESDPIQTY